jgi:nucleotide-binding universal stress UspA family protein
VGLPAAAGGDPPPLDDQAARARPQAEDRAVTASRSRPVVFAYDGSDLAKAAIDEAGRQLDKRREALVVTVWRPADVGSVPLRGLEIDAARGDEVRKAAEETAADGAARAEAAGFGAESRATEAAPTWKGIVDVADECDAGLIVLGSHGRGGFAGALVGSVAGAVAVHCRQPVLIVHRRT